MLDDFRDKFPLACELLLNEFKNNMLSHAYLIDVNNSSLLDSFILAFVKALVCPNKLDSYSGCNSCSVCKLVDENSYPEVKIIKPDGNFIKKGQIIELQQNFSKSSIYGNKLVYIIYDCEKMRPEAANSMLKFLEEPNSSIVAILVTNNFNSVLSTIISRCQIVKLNSSYNDFVSNDLIFNSLNFIESIENRGIDVICDVKELFFKFVDSKNREEVTLFIDNMIDLYYDMLKLFIDSGSNIRYYQYKEQMDIIIKKNNITTLINKINFLIDAKDSVKYNVNINLLVDSIILGIGGKGE